MASRVLGAVILSLVACSSIRAQVDVLTQHNDTDRTGHNAAERVLTPSSVATGRFGRLYDLAVDGQVYAQPLVVNGTVIVATAKNWVYFFDAGTGRELWRRQFTPAPDYLPALSPQDDWPDTGNLYLDLTPYAGIMSTPVVDRRTNTLYFTTYSERIEEQDDFRIDVWALDLVTRREKYGSPVRVVQPPSFDVSDPEVAAVEHDHGEILPRHTIEKRPIFSPDVQMQRVGLLLVKGRLLLGFGSFGDAGKYHGWIFSYNATDLADPNVGVFVSTTASERFENPQGGIWQSGMGLTLDSEQNVFFMTGNGAWDPESGNYGDSVVRLTVDGASLVDAKHFTPCNQACLSARDLDLGTSGLLHVPGTNRVVGGGKQGILYVLDTADPGGGRPSPDCPRNPDWNDPACRRTTPCMTCTNRVVQQFQASCGDMSTGFINGGHIHGAPVHYRSAPGGEAIYVWAEDDKLRAFVFDRATGRFRTGGCDKPNPEWSVGPVFSPWYRRPGMTGGMLSLSSDRGANGIVWATTPTNTDANQRVVTGMLWAFAAADLRRPLWYSYLPCGRADGQPDLSIRDFRRCEPNDVGNYAKFTPPTIANGKVYVATFSNRVSVYGLNAPPAPAIAPNLLGNNGDFEDGITGWTGTNFRRLDDWPHYGLWEGRLEPGKNGTAAARYTITAPRDGRYALTAWVATDLRPEYLERGEPVTLAIVTSSGTVRAVPVEAFAGYQKYGVEVDASSGQELNIVLSVPRVVKAPQKMDWSCRSGDLHRCPYALIDDVVLTVK